MPEGVPGSRGERSLVSLPGGRTGSTPRSIPGEPARWGQQVSCLCPRSLFSSQQPEQRGLEPEEAINLEL